MKLKYTMAAVVVPAMLAGCGGGGGGSSSDAPAGATCQPTMANPLACSASMSLALVDAAGSAPTTQVAPDAGGTLVVTIKDWDNKPIANTLVTFGTTDASSSGTLVPASGTALTDANGVARMGLAAGSRVGAFTASASASVNGSKLVQTTNYSVVFPTLTLSPLTISPQTLPAGANAAVSVTVLSAGQTYTAPTQVKFSSPCIAAGKAVLGSPVTTQAGVARASYSDKGCGVADVITATVTLGESTATQTGTINVLPASAGSVSFLASDTTNIALAGTGGVGRQEFATLKFKVFDTTGTAVSGVPVSFSFADQNGVQLTTLGGLQLNPATATTSADGTVTTLVSGGTIPTSVRVKASVSGANLATLSTLSNVLVVSTGVPDQRHFSLSTTIGNCEGWDLDQDECSIVTARMADHFGNPVPDGTAVNFTVEGGNIQASCITGELLSATTPAGESTNSQQGPGSGACSVQLRSANPRPAGGRVTVLAYALGEENFTDRNGNNRCDNCDTFSTAADAEFGLEADRVTSQDKRPDIFRDDNENGAYTAGEPCIGPNTSGKCDTPADGRYNGVLRNPPAPNTAPTTYVSAQYVQLFSGSEARITFDQTRLTCAAGTTTTTVQVYVKDVNGNPMPAGTKINLQAMYGTDIAPVVPASHTVNNYKLGVGSPTPEPVYKSVVGCNAGPGTLIVTVTTPVTKTESTEMLPIN